MKNTLKFALVGALLAVAAPVASAANCYEVAKNAAKEISAKPGNVLSIVSKQVAANKGCACEIVKAAIVATEADKKQVAAIVKSAIKAAPKKVSLITTCALAVAPDAHAEVMAVASKYSANKGGSYSAKGAKNGVAGNEGTAVEENFDPLSFIGLDPTGNFSANQFILPGANGGGGGQTAPGNTYSQP